jgi:hypothetical protein
MRYRKLDANGDYTMTGTSSDWLVNTPAAVGQAVLTGLKLRAGEWFLDTSAGAPWSSILGKFSGTNYDVLLKDQILGTTGVTAITSYSSTFDSTTRKLSVSVAIDTLYGATTLAATL